MALICLDGLLFAGINIVGVVGPKKDHHTFNNFKKLVLSKELNFIDYDELDNADFIEKVKNLNADIAVVCSFNYKVPKVLLDSVKDGFVNAHPSLLPDYKGANPYSYIIMNNEAKTGVTLHFMDETFDTGDIISQESFPISRFETMGTLFNRTNILVLEMLLKFFKLYETEKIKMTKQPQGNFKRSHTINESDLFISFYKSATEIESFIRALNPFLIARTTFRRNVTRILSADIIETDIKNEIGTIVKVEADKFYIQTGEGLLSPTALQFGSFFAGAAKDFIRILGPKIGEKFE